VNDRERAAHEIVEQLVRRAREVADGLQVARMPAFTSRTVRAADAPRHASG